MSQILSAPNPVLSVEAKKYTFREGDNFLPKFLQEMEQALLSAHDPVGVGLAAPQIGKSLAIFITKPTDKSPIQVFINPEIIETAITDAKSPATKEKKEMKLEGCLSLPDVWGQVKRSSAVTLTYWDENGKNYTKKFNGFMATIIQHEVDHLHGILFPKRVIEQKGKLYHSSKNPKGEDEFEEIEI